jgi:hypothetical protein
MALARIVEPKVKGVAFRSIEGAFAELRGEAARQKAREYMRPELHDAIERGLILPSGWYPISWYRELFTAYRAATGDGPELARQIGIRSSQRDMRSVYKQIFARLVSPQTLLGMSSNLFSTYYDTGKFEVLESHRGYVKVRMQDCIGWDLNMWTEITGSCVSLLETAGAKQVRLRVLSGARDGDTGAELEAYWV